MGERSIGTSVVKKARTSVKLNVKSFGAKSRGADVTGGITSDVIESEIVEINEIVDVNVDEMEKTDIKLNDIRAIYMLKTKCFVHQNSP